jgi:isoleucyl-tRNA synthetase
MSSDSAASGRFASVSDKISFPGEEDNVLSYWEEIDAFQESLRLSKDRPEFSFYDGPPFATGLPHYG